MPDRYTVERQGARWVASNGAQHVEADDPSEAIYLLTAGELLADASGESVEDEAASISAGEAENLVGAAALRLVRLLVMRAPAELLRKELEMVQHWTERHIALRGD